MKIGIYRKNNRYWWEKKLNEDGLEGLFKKILQGRHLKKNVEK